MNQAHPYSKHNPLLEDLLAPRKICFIVNPNAGVKQQEKIKTHLERYLDHKKYEYGIKYTEKAGHATQLAQLARAEGYEIVTAVGGDGSINEVAKGLIGSDTCLGILPAGSGNGMAMHLGYGRSLEEAIKKLNRAKKVTIDTGLFNGKPFVNLAGIGFDGLVSNLMKTSSKRGFIPYFLKSMQAGLTYQSKHCKITYLDEKQNPVTIEENCFAITVANGPMYGYNVTIAPDASLDNGLLSVVILKDAPRWQYIAAVPWTLTGGIYIMPFVHHFQTTKLTIMSEGEQEAHIDGEGMKTTGNLEFSIRPLSLHILVPQ